MQISGRYLAASVTAFVATWQLFVKGKSKKIPPAGNDRASTGDYELS
jgi:hypothetical protein